MQLPKQLNICDIENNSKHCKQCQGTGVKFTMIIEDYMMGEEICDCVKRRKSQKCVICQGKGYRIKSSTELVRIPRGSLPNQTLKVSGKGSKNNDLSGDLILTLAAKIKG